MSIITSIAIVCRVLLLPTARSPPTIEINIWHCSQGISGSSGLTGKTIFMDLSVHVFSTEIVLLPRGQKSQLLHWFPTLQRTTVTNKYTVPLRNEHFMGENHLGGKICMKSPYGLGN